MLMIVVMGSTFKFQTQLQIKYVYTHGPVAAEGWI